MVPNLRRINPLPRSTMTLPRVANLTLKKLEVREAREARGRWLFLALVWEICILRGTKRRYVYLL